MFEAETRPDFWAIFGVNMRRSTLEVMQEPKSLGSCFDAHTRTFATYGTNQGPHCRLSSHRPRTPIGGSWMRTWPHPSEVTGVGLFPNTSRSV